MFGNDTRRNMIPQAYDERVTIGARWPRPVLPARRLRCLRTVSAALRCWHLGERTGVAVDNMREGSGGEPVAAFSMSHPAVPALYMVLTLGLTMFSMQPVLIALSLAGGLAYGFATRGTVRTLGALRWQLPVILIIALVNPLFSASGSTELFRIGMRAVHLESLVYGLCMGGLFVASVLWFEAAASMLEYDKVLALLGNAAPVIALMISMCMRLIPQFLRRGRTVLAVQDAIDVPGRAPADPVRSRLRASSVLMGWGMEDSLERADAMRSRGWGAVPRRTTYARYRLGRSDVVALVGLALFGAVAVAVAWTATTQYSFYPQLSVPAPWQGYVVYAVWMALPCVLCAIDEKRFG